MKVNKDFVMRSIAGENILVPTGEAAEKLNGMITLNEVAAFMWQNLDSAGSKEALVKMILDEFEVDEETGTTLTMNIGNDYSLIYGQLKDVTVSEGEVVEQGTILGYVSEPTKYYCEEGSNLYFQMKKDGQPVDPMLYLE